MALFLGAVIGDLHIAVVQIEADEPGEGEVRTAKIVLEFIIQEIPISGTILRGPLPFFISIGDISKAMSHHAEVVAVWIPLALIA